MIDMLLWVCRTLPTIVQYLKKIQKWAYHSLHYHVRVFTLQMDILVVNLTNGSLCRKYVQEKATIPLDDEMK